MLHKRQKAGRYRGSKTHGCGSMKKRRGKKISKTEKKLLENLYSSI